MDTMNLEQQRALTLARARARAAQAGIGTEGAVPDLDTARAEAQRNLDSAIKQQRANPATRLSKYDTPTVIRYRNEVNRLNAMTPEEYGATPGMAASFGKGMLSGAAKVITKPIELGFKAAEAVGVPGAQRANIAAEKGRQRSERDLAKYRTAAPTTFKTGKIVGETAALVPAMGILAAPVRAFAGGTKAGQVAATALESQGFKTGLLPTREAVEEGLAVAPTLVDRAVDLAVRGVAGATTGYTASKLTDTDATAGTIVGALMPTAGSMAVRSAVDKVIIPLWKRMTGEFGVEQASKIFRSAFNMGVQQAVNLARKAPANMPFAQFLASAGKNEPTVQALGKMVSEGPGRSYFAPLAEESQQARQAVLNQMAGGATPTEAQNFIAAQAERLKSKYGPKISGIFERANIGGKVIPQTLSEAERMRQAAAGFTEDVRRFAPAAERFGENAKVGAAESSLENVGFLRTPEQARMDALAGQAEKYAVEQANASLGAGATARALEQNVADLRSQGIDVLSTAPLVSKIRQMAQSEGVLGSEVQHNSLMDLAQQIESLGPIARAGDLDAIERDAALTASKFTNDVSGIKQHAATLIGRVKPLIRTAIEEAGGKGYTAAKRGYAAGKHNLAQREFIGQLAELHAAGPAGETRMAEIVRGRKPETVKEAFPYGGAKRADINAMIAPKRMGKLEKVASEIELGAKMEKQAHIGEADARALLKKERTIGDSIKGTLLTFVAPKAAHLSDFVEAISKSGVSQRTQQELVKGFKNGESAAQLLSYVPAANKAQVARRMMNNTWWRARANAGIALAGAATEKPNKNAMAR